MGGIQKVGHVAGVLVLAAALAASAVAGERPVTVVIEPLMPRQVVVKGLLGQAIEASYQRRLRQFIKDESSEPLALFAESYKAKNTAGDWYGEHAGKWLVAASHAADRANDAALRATVLKVADYLVSRQEPSGYLGTYAPGADARFTSPNVYGKRTWDVWVHAYMILGLLEVNRFWPNPKYLDAARKIGDLFISVFGRGDKSLAMLGNHQGLSSTILLEPMVKLHQATEDTRYLDFARLIVRQAEAREGLQPVSRSLEGLDLSQIGTGKIYQLGWNFVGILRLFEVTGERDYLRAARNAWQNISDYHLTLAGAPWGGVAGHHEVFNDKEFFNPYGFVETCSVMSWIHLNRDLLRLSGDARFAEEIEKSLYSSLLGAQDPNGEDWCYFTFPNGKRNNTYYWACCKSSGALALEEIAPLAYGRREDGLTVNLYTESSMKVVLPKAGETKLTQTTAYPGGSEVKLVLEPATSVSFPLWIRIPSWAEGASVAVNGKPAGETPVPGRYCKLLREWKHGDEVRLTFPMKLKVHLKTYTVDHHGQEIVKMDYFALTRGPLLYATGLIDGYKKEETVKIPKLFAEAQFSAAPVPPGFNGPAFQLNLPGRNPILFLPYYEAGGRSDGKWRSTWIAVAWQ